jgi:octanoyl-[GcvH]:protein N-octanoyltransferase
MDSGIHTASPIEPLAYDEAIAAGMSQPGAHPLIHLWVYDKALFLGRRDVKLPKLEAALRDVSREGYAAVLRSSGGACVPLDRGVLNIAFHLPGTAISIDAFFQLVSAMLKIGLADFGAIQFGEVKGSYCVGDYDFAINGKKIGGMAQRRTRYGSILQLCVNVTELPRGTLMERFYEIAGLDEMEQHKPIPEINGATVSSIQAETNLPVTVPDVKERLLRALQKHWQLKEQPFSLPAQRVKEARHHLLDKLGLFAYQAEEMQSSTWKFPS